MDVHVENTALPTLSKSAGWHIVPIDRLPMDRMVRKLSGVPKGALRTVFGKALGRRIWEQVRRPRPLAGQAERAGPTLPNAGAVTLGVTDSELIVAMIESVSRRAAETLDQHRRQAKALGLKLVHSDGSVKTESARLARPSADASEIAAAAVELFQRCALGDSPLVSINLTTTTVQTEALLDSVAPFGCPVTATHA
jgi:nucleotidyltransferase/DNA polymerase involved in DNA repair